MMLTLLRIAWLNLRRDRVAQALTFLLPIIFFSIFATVFGGRGGDGNRTPRVQVAVVDEDRSEFSGRIVDALRKDGNPEPGVDDPVLHRTAARVFAHDDRGSAEGRREESELVRTILAERVRVLEDLHEEELLVASLSTCHMLWVLHLAADAGITLGHRGHDAVGERGHAQPGSEPEEAEYEKDQPGTVVVVSMTTVRTTRATATNTSITALNARGPTVWRSFPAIPEPTIMPAAGATSSRPAGRRTCRS